MLIGRRKAANVIKCAGMDLATQSMRLYVSVKVDRSTVKAVSNFLSVGKISSSSGSSTPKIAQIIPKERI